MEPSIGKLLVVAALAWTLAPSTARAEWLFTPNVGGVFGGPAAGGATWGATIGWMGDGFTSNNLLTTDEAPFFGGEPTSTHGRGRLINQQYV